MPLTFEEKLQSYADLIVQVGANIQPGQNVMFRAPLEGAALGRKIVESAYKAGARFVDVLWNDDAVMLSTFRHAAADVFETIPSWQREALVSSAKRGDAFIEIRATDPELFKDLDPNRVASYEASRRRELREFSEAITNSDVNWCLVTMPIKSWAAKVFQNTDDAVNKLWDAIFRAVRVDQPNAVEAWKDHLEKLEQRRHYLNEKRFQQLHYKAPGTDLVVGLPEGHGWYGGIQPTHSGIVYVANLPTEEVFTLPHKNRVDGVVSSSKPLAYAGNIIDGIVLRFKDGRVVEAKASQGEASLHKLLETDEGARHLGEVALVPHSSPISQSGILFFNTLFDENAASHLALGRAYKFTLQGGTTMTDADAEAAGVNNSLTHVDFMIGSHEMDIEGIRANGEREAVMRAGEWAL